MYFYLRIKKILLSFKKLERKFFGPFVGKSLPVLSKQSSTCRKKPFEKSFYLSTVFSLPSIFFWGFWGKFLAASEMLPKCPADEFDVLNLFQKNLFLNILIPGLKNLRPSDERISAKLSMLGPQDLFEGKCFFFEFSVLFISFVF